MNSDEEKKKWAHEGFLANLVHDLKAPVITIGGYASRLLDRKMGDLTPEQQKGLQIILRNCERLEHDLQMILQHMKVDLAEQLSLEVFDITETARRVCETLRPDAEKKNISVDLKKPYEPVKIEADPLIIHKAIFNLVDNAIRYTDPGGKVRVTISLKEDFVDIRVADDGKGIEKQKLDLVLKPFEEVMQVRDRELRGFGLGLSNVKRYIELHGGTLDAESKPGEGSEFNVRLPRSSQKSSSENL